MLLLTRLSSGPQIQQVADRPSGLSLRPQACECNQIATGALLSLHLRHAKIAAHHDLRLWSF